MDYSLDLVEGPLVDIGGQVESWPELLSKVAVEFRGVVAAFRSMLHNVEHLHLFLILFHLVFLLIIYLIISDN